MSLDLLLFALRIISGLLLFGILSVFFVVIWKDYRSAAAQAQVFRQTYGQVQALVQVDGVYGPTGESHPLRPLTSFGRSPTNSIVINDNYASGEHAIISLKEGRWWLEDRNSRNGTILNGEPVFSPIILTDGDIISIGTSHYKITIDA